MQGQIDTAHLREAVAATMFQNCTSRPWTAASETERLLFLTGANQAIGMIVDAIEKSLRQSPAKARVH